MNIDEHYIVWYITMISNWYPDIYINFYIVLLLSYCFQIYVSYAIKLPMDTMYCHLHAAEWPRKNASSAAHLQIPAIKISAYPESCHNDDDDGNVIYTKTDFQTVNIHLISKKTVNSYLINGQW